MIGLLAFTLLALSTYGASAGPTLTVQSHCQEDIWVFPQSNDKNAPVPAPGLAKAAPGATLTYDMSGGWKGRMHVKTGCDGSGQNCKTGQTVEPCPQGGCEVPANTLIEFNFDSQETWYDLSLVDGYDKNMEIIPSQTGGSCVRTNCNVKIEDCPTHEIDNLGNLNYQNKQCLSPCKRWNYPAPAGLGKSEQEDPGKQFCCPHPVSSEDCNKGEVIKTQYVALVHKNCPTAYAYSYDDLHALHKCPAGTSFHVNVCSV